MAYNLYWNETFNVMVFEDVKGNIYFRTKNKYTGHWNEWKKVFEKD